MKGFYLKYIILFFVNGQIHLIVSVFVFFLYFLNAPNTAKEFLLAYLNVIQYDIHFN